jgi:enoyl-[acyl-carrier protein] reductase I
MDKSLAGLKILITGIANENSLALEIARELKREGAELVCAGLGVTRHHASVSDAAARFLRESQERFEKAVAEGLGCETPTVLFDASLDESLADAANELSDMGFGVDGVLHAIAMDRTIRGGAVKPLLEVSRSEFLDCMSVSAYSLIGILRALHERSLLNERASVVSLSYLGAERVMKHPYRNIGVAKAALERITRELAVELGSAWEVRVNAVRFSPYAESRAGGAIPGLAESVKQAGEMTPLGHATPGALAQEVAFLMRPENMVAGEIRHVDGGYHVLG